MSYYVMRSSSDEKNYIVLRHGIPHTNVVLLGVKFRDSFAVVEKDSKTYFRLLKFPFMKNTAEMPLTFLKKLPFIIRSADVKQIYGADVYAKYIKQLEIEKNLQEEVEEEVKYQERLQDDSRCTYVKPDGKVCGNFSMEKEAVPYCNFHVLEDPRLKEIGFKVRPILTKAEKKSLRKDAAKELKKLHRSILYAAKNKDISEETSKEEEKGST